MACGADAAGMERSGSETADAARLDGVGMMHLTPRPGDGAVDGWPCRMQRSASIAAPCPALPCSFHPSSRMRPILLSSVHGHRSVDSALSPMGLHRLIVACCSPLCAAFLSIGSRRSKSGHFAECGSRPPRTPFFAEAPVAHGDQDQTIFPRRTCRNNGTPDGGSRALGSVGWRSTSEFGHATA
jgi:hypothetical protein